MDTKTLPELLTTGDVARAFGVGLGAARKWLEDGKIPSFKTPGGHRRVHRHDVEALLNSTQ